MSLPEPPIPPDGSCARCRGPRNYDKLRQPYRTHAERDAFCSSECCRDYFGHALPKAGWSRLTYTSTSGGGDA